MNSDELTGKWEQLKGKIKEKWGKLTDNDVAVINGKKDQLVGKVRERYGYTIDQAEREYNAFMKECGCSDSKSKSQPSM